MKQVLPIFIFCFLTSSLTLSAQTIKPEKDRLEAINVSASIVRLFNKNVVKVTKDTAIKTFDEPTFARLKGIEFKNGTIELRVLSKLLPDAPQFARGFIGVAFRINDNNSKFECIYIRPANGRDGSQIRRNHSIQYFSFPDYQFERLRKEAAGEYESYSDMALNEWITLKIVVRNAQAKLFINNNREPSLIVNDLKHGPDASGSLGLWVDVGTEGFFTDLKITQKP